MPLLHKKPFIKKKPSPTMKPTEKVFFCELTEEVFTDYDEFWERLVLLNALVWTCELTGRPNLTYHEALECEKKARKCISNVSLALKKPLLYISTLTKRGRIIDACDDIFVYIRDRYFVGEEVEAIVNNHWYDCKVTKVIMPTKEQISDYQKSLEESDSDDEIQCISDSMVNGKTHKDDDDDDDIIIVRDDHCKSTPVKNKSTNNTKEENEEYPPFPTVRYEVIEIEAWDYKEPKVHKVGWDQIRRSKSAFTREKSKLFVKQYMVLGHEGYWKIKDSIAKQFKIPETTYNDIFVGNPPKFEETILKRVPMQLQVVKNEKRRSNNNNNKTARQREEKEKREIKPENNKQEADAKKKKKPIMTEEDREAARKFQLELKEKSKELFRKKLEQKKIDTKFKKDVDKEIGRLMRLYEADWWQKREDLECEDHKDLPSPQSFTCRIPLDYFGDFLMILDFVNTFAKLLELGDVYPDGITYEMLEQAFVTKEVAGVFNDVVQLLLGAIFSLQEEEDEEVEGDSTVDMASMNVEDNLESKCLMNAVHIANKAATWSQQYQGVSLQKAPLDALTLTEILRLHILASGATNVANAFWRHVNRGGYKHTDDPGLQFKLDEPEIIKKLSTESLFDLAIEEKVKILTCLVSQILTYASVRDNVEEKVEKLKELSYNYRMYKFAVVRREKEETNAKKQKIKDIKMKVEKQLFEQRMQGGSTNTVLDAEKARTIMMGELEEAEDVEKETRATYKKREEAENKERDFIDQIEILTKEMKQFQQGQDRAFRRYWVFNAIPGFYIEDKNDNRGSCMDYPTPVRPIIYPKDNKELAEVIRAQALRNIKIKSKEKEIEKNNSDKENENSFKTPTKTESKTPLLEKNSLQASNSNIVKSNVVNEDGKEDSLSPKLDDEEEEIVDLVCLPEDLEEQDIENLEELHSKIFGLCSADSLTCPVHTLNHSRPKWSHFKSEEDLEKLIENLNERGVRESELKSNLILNKDKILKSIRGSLSFSFEPTQKDESQIDLKKGLKSNLNFPPDTPVDRILELTLRDMILEIEEKIDNGMLGGLNVPSRDDWRQGLVDGTALVSNTHQDLDWGGKKRINQFKSSLGMEMAEEDLLDSDDFVAKEGSAHSGVVKELAIAILQVAQALELKYLKDPLAESSKLHKKRKSLEEKLNSKYRNKKAEGDGHNEASEDEENHEVKSSNTLPKNIDNSLRTPFERWEKSLMACTSFSQLFLHLATLDDSITWKRSAVTKKRCRVCKRQNESNSMLLCDGCDGGFHMSCLKPKMKSIPEGDWYCDKCKPKVKPKSPRKQRQAFNEEVDEEEEEDDDEEQEEEEEEDEEEKEDQEEPEFINLEYCYACGLGGEIVLCDTCPKSFHLQCVELRKIPRGNWSCPFCKEKRNSANSNSKRKSESGSAKKKKRLKTDEEIDAVLMQNSQSHESVNGGEVNRSRKNLKRSSDEMENDNIFHSSEIESLIHKLMSHNDSGPFRKPIYRNLAPDYYEKIKKPMDLRTVKMRYNRNKYVNDTEFIGDVLLIFQNTQQYFDEDTVEYKAGLKVSKYFLDKVKTSNLHTGGLIENELQPPSKRRRQS